MKKSIFLLVFLITSFTSIGQTLSIDTVISFDSALTQNDLHTKALIFVSNYFKTPNSVIQVDDKEAGLITCKGSFDFEPSKAVEDALVTYLVTFRFKDGKVKMTVTNFYHKNLMYDGRGEGIVKIKSKYEKNYFINLHKELVAACKLNSENLINSFYETAVKENEDW